MKKFLSLLLAAMMLLGCTTAMAEGDVDTTDKFDTILNGTAEWDDDGTVDGADIDVSVLTNYGDEDKFDTEGEMATELWLQVDATGQIDVTVPLVLVFQTNIDGGTATSPDEYQITNNSSADLVVTKIAVTDVAYDADKQPMTMVEFTETPAEDQYKVQLSAAETAVKGKGQSGVYDLNTALHEQDRLLGGLFELKKANSDGTGVDTDIDVTMTTGRLSFVTSRKGTEEDAGMDTDKGIQLLTITYTVAIDTSDAIGEAITTEDSRTASPLKGEDDEDEHTKIVERTTSEAEEMTADEDTTTP